MQSAFQYILRSLAFNRDVTGGIVRAVNEQALTQPWYWEVSHFFYALFGEQFCLSCGQLQRQCGAWRDGETAKCMSGLHVVKGTHFSLVHFSCRP